MIVGQHVPVTIIAPASPFASYPSAVCKHQWARADPRLGEEPRMEPRGLTAYTNAVTCQLSRSGAR